MLVASGIPCALYALNERDWKPTEEWNAMEK